MVENIFSMRKIDSECQRHELLLSSLDLQHLQRVEHRLLDLDPVFPYSYLKAAFLTVCLPHCDCHSSQQLEFHRTLSFSKHVSSLKAKFFPRLKALRCIFASSWGPSKECLSLLYKSFLWPLLTYAGFLS